VERSDNGDYVVTTLVPTDGTDEEIVHRIREPKVLRASAGRRHFERIGPNDHTE
jgi:hypothetical protein